MAAKTQQGYAGQGGPSNSTSDFNKLWFLVRQMIGMIRTATIVRIEAVYGGSLGPIGTLDVLPLVNLVDGIGNASKHDTIFGLPYCRVQGGKNAVICDPQVGDIGLAVFADRDISAVKASNGQQSNPGSRRRHSWADGIYVFTIISETPDQYVIFKEDGITIQDKNGNSILMNDTGMSINILNGAGVLNIMGSALQVNGVTVIVP